MFCDNKYVYKNVSTPDSTLKKNNVIICYYKCRKAVDYGVARISKEGITTNLDDFFTNILIQTRRETLLGNFMN